MKVYLDDMRVEPAGWERTRTAQQTIDLLNTRTVTHLSLDHDLGCCKRCLADADDYVPADCSHNGSGYDVACWLERAVIEDPTFPVPELYVHSANPWGVQRIRQVFEAIKRRKTDK